MNHRFRSLCLMATLLLGASWAVAGAQAQRVYLCQVWLDWSPRESASPCMNSEKHLSDRVVVSIQVPSGDVGYPGAFYIGVRKDGQPFGAFVGKGAAPNDFNSGPKAPPAPGVSTTNRTGGTWTAPMNSGLLTAAQVFTALDGAVRQYTVIEDGMICQQLGKGRFELWAGHGALNMVDRTVMNVLQPRLGAVLNQEQVLLTRLQQDMQDRQTMWMVLQGECPG